MSSRRKKKHKEDPIREVGEYSQCLNSTEPSKLHDWYSTPYLGKYYCSLCGAITIN